jgi:hypothetical protein
MAEIKVASGAGGQSLPGSSLSSLVPFARDLSET